jgi:hypothetical protein
MMTIVAIAGWERKKIRHPKGVRHQILTEEPDFSQISNVPFNPFQVLNLDLKAEFNITTGLATANSPVFFRQFAQ